MRDFDTMMMDTTTYVDFMKLFEKIIGIFNDKGNPFVRENPDVVAALKACFDQYKNLDFKGAWKLK